LTTALGRQASGLALTVLGAMLGAGGFITNEEEDEKLKKLMESQGMKGSYLNLSRFTRVFNGWDDPESGKYQEGDVLVSFSWALPAFPFLILGARIQQAKTDAEAENLISTFTTAFGETTGDFFEVPFVRTAKTLTNSNMEWNDKLGKMVSDWSTSFIPAVIKQTSQLLDPNAKKTKYSGEGSMKDAITVSLPGKRNELGNMLDIKGDAMSYHYGDSPWVRVFNAYFNPSYVSEVQYDKDLQKIMKAYEDNKIDSLPSDKLDYFTSGGKRYDLEGEQYGYFKERYIYHFANTRNNDGDTFDTYLATERAKSDVLKRFTNLKPKK
jgi:hypothetical protein